MASYTRCSGGWRFFSGAADPAWAVWLGVAPASFLFYSATTTSYCESPQPTSSREPSSCTDASADNKTYAIDRLLQWLQLGGADVSAITIKPSYASSQKDQKSQVTTAGLGVFMAETGPDVKKRSGLRVVWDWLHRSNSPVKLAEFSLAQAVTAETAVHDPVLGPSFQHLLEQGVLNERTAVMLLLLIERMKGTSSNWYPWMSVLPSEFDTPLYWDEQDLKQLRGTTLYSASEALKRRVMALWNELHPFVKELLQLVGVDAIPQLEDWLWAYSTFWSRAQSIPLALTGEHSLVLEGIVPGLDFCNHSPSAACWWETLPSTDQPSSGVIQLLASGRQAPKSGQEVFIDYGGKSNEELLMLYGFTLPNNPNDMVMVQCPVPPVDQWNDATRARMQLLQARGLLPQFFLPSPTASTPLVTATDPHLNPGIRDVLEVLVMEGDQLFKALEAEDSSTDTSPASSSSTSPTNLKPQQLKPASQLTASELQECIEQSSLDMAVYSSLVSLLQLKMQDLEGPEGTGSLEKDESLLTRGPTPLTRPRKWQALIYRVEQKRIVRHHLQQASSMLQQVVTRLEDLIAAESSVKTA